MNLFFTSEQMKAFLLKRGFHFALYKGAYLDFSGSIETEKMEEVLIAIRKKDMEKLKNLYWKEEIKEYSLENVFNKEMAKTLSKL